jgi:hypothetical protein
MVLIGRDRSVIVSSAFIEWFWISPGSQSWNSLHHSHGAVKQEDSESIVSREWSLTPSIEIRSVSQMLIFRLVSIVSDCVRASSVTASGMPLKQTNLLKTEQGHGYERRRKRKKGETSNITHFRTVNNNRITIQCFSSNQISYINIRCPTTGCFEKNPQLLSFVWNDDEIWNQWEFIEDPLINSDVISCFDHSRSHWKDIGSFWWNGMIGELITWDQLFEIVTLDYDFMLDTNIDISMMKALLMHNVRLCSRSRSYFGTTLWSDSISSRFSELLQINVRFNV